MTEKLQFLSYDQFFAESKHISMAFRELGIGPKDFAAVSWINSKEFLEVMYGTTSLNMVLQPLYPNLDAHAVKYVLKQGLYHLDRIEISTYTSNLSGFFSTLNTLSTAWLIVTVFICIIFPLSRIVNTSGYFIMHPIESKKEKKQRIFHC